MTHTTPDHWLTVRQATDLVNASRLEGTDPISARQMRRRLYHLDASAKAVGRTRLLKWVSRHRVLVSAEALLRELRTDPSLHETVLAEVQSRQDDFERKLHAIRSRLRALQKQLDSHILRTGGRDVQDRR